MSDLVARKTAEHEQTTLADDDFAFYERDYARLRGELEATHEACRLPEQTSAVPELDALLIRLRTEPRG